MPMRSRDYGKYTTFAKTLIDIIASTRYYHPCSVANKCFLPFFFSLKIQLLQCIEQIPSLGGANQFADGFHVSKLLRDLDPKKFDLLSSSQLNFYDVGEDTFGDFDMKVAHTTIE